MDIVKLLYPSQCQLGEGPFCHAGRLYWLDILQQQLHHCDEQGSKHQLVALDEMFSAGAVLENANLLLASGSALWQYQTNSQQLEKLHELESVNPLTRSNDGRADRQGGFWISTMGKNAEPQAGAIYRYYKGELVQLKSQVSIPNAICFSPAGEYAYFADSADKLIYRWLLDNAGWPQGEPQLWVDLSDQPVDPDGAVIDSAGYMWNAQWDGSQLVRYNPAGAVDQVIKMPVSRPTCPAFSTEGDRLFISSARVGLSDSDLEQQPQAGGVFVLPLSVKGLPDARVLL